MLLCDGHGIAHPCRFGIAAHLGVLTDLPSIGVAKSVLSGPMAKCLKNVELGSRCDTEGSALVLQYELA